MTKREIILQTAMSLFIEKGIQSTSTASIAKAANVATGTLFHHFKTKEELITQLYNLIFDSLIAYHKENFKEDVNAYGKRERQYDEMVADRCVRGRHLFARFFNSLWD